MSKRCCSVAKNMEIYFTVETVIRPALRDHLSRTSTIREWEWVQLDYALADQPKHCLSV